MREQFIPYELALELKELRFDEECLVTESKVGFSRNPSHDMEELLIQGEPYYWKNSKIHSDNCTLPLWQQAFDWLLNKIPNYSIRICYNKTGEICSGKLEKYIFDNLEECLKKLIEIVKNK